MEEWQKIAGQARLHRRAAANDNRHANGETWRKGINEGLETRCAVDQLTCESIQA